MASRRQHRLKPDEIEALVAARLAGAEILELAAQFEVDRATVLNHLRRAGVPHRAAQGRTLSSEQVQAAGQLYASGQSLVAVGEQFGVDKRYLRRVLREIGVVIRGPGGVACA